MLAHIHESLSSKISEIGAKSVFKSMRIYLTEMNTLNPNLKSFKLHEASLIDTSSPVSLEYKLLSVEYVDVGKSSMSFNVLDDGVCTAAYGDIERIFVSGKGKSCQIFFRKRPSKFYQCFPDLCKDSKDSAVCFKFTFNVESECESFEQLLYTRLDDTGGTKSSVVSSASPGQIPKNFPGLKESLQVPPVASSVSSIKDHENNDNDNHYDNDSISEYASTIRTEVGRKKVYSAKKKTPVVRRSGYQKVKGNQFTYDPDEDDFVDSKIRVAKPATKPTSGNIMVAANEKSGRPAKSNPSKFPADLATDAPCQDEVKAAKKSFNEIKSSTEVALSTRSHGHGSVVRGEDLIHGTNKNPVNTVEERNSFTEKEPSSKSEKRPHRTKKTPETKIEEPITSMYPSDKVFENVPDAVVENEVNCKLDIPSSPLNFESQTSVSSTVSSPPVSPVRETGAKSRVFTHKDENKGYYQNISEDPDSDDILETLISQLVVIENERKERRRAKNAIAIISTATQQVSDYLKAWEEMVESSCNQLDINDSMRDVAAVASGISLDSSTFLRKLQDGYSAAENSLSDLETVVPKLKTSSSKIFRELKDQEKDFVESLSSIRHKWKMHVEQNISLSYSSSSNPTNKKIKQTR